MVITDLDYQNVTISQVRCAAGIAGLKLYFEGVFSAAGELHHLVTGERHIIPNLRWRIGAIAELCLVPH